MRDRWLIALVAIVATAYLLLLPRFLERLDPLTGDEPFYVMTALSLMHDGDLDERNNYAQRDYERFYPPDPLPEDWRGWPAFPRELPPHPAQSRLPGLHTKHGLGLSVIIALPWALAGRTGADLVIVACGVALAGQMYLLGRDGGATQRLAATIAAGLALVLPIAPYALLLFPEVPAALALVYGARRLAAPVNAGWQWLLTGAAVATLPWLHQRFLPTAAVLGVVLLWRARHVLNAWRIAAIGVAAAGGLGIVAYNLWLYGSPIQNRADHAGFHGPVATVNAAFGLLLDAQWGLLIVAPVYLLAVTALPWWAVRAPRLFALAGAAILPYLVVVAAYRVWWGEWGPAARYLVPVAPFAAAALASWLCTASRPWRLVTAAAWGIGAVVSLVGYADPQRLYHHPDGLNKLIVVIDDRLGTGIAAQLVAFQPYALSPALERVALSLALAFVVAALVLLIVVRSALGASRE